MLQNESFTKKLQFNKTEKIQDLLFNLLDKR